MKKISEKIQSARVKLEELIGQDLKSLQDPRIIELSQQLDTLIVEELGEMKDHVGQGSIEKGKVIFNSYFHS